MRIMIVLLIMMATACGSNLPSSADQEMIGAQAQSIAQITTAPPVTSIPRPTSTPEPTPPATITHRPTPDRSCIQGEDSSGSEITVTFDGGNLPAGYTLQSITLFTLSFVDRFNRGNWYEFSGYFDFGGDFKRFGAEGITYHTQDTVQAYYQERQKQEERWQLKRLEAYPYPDGIGLNFVITRQAMDIQPDPGGSAPYFVGKAGISCEKGKGTVLAWYTSFRADEEPGLCPNPSGGSSSDTVIACTEGWTEA